MSDGRTPEEVFQHHIEALGAADLDGIVSDYADDAIFITPGEVKRGKEGVREAFAQLLEDLPDANWDIRTTTYEEDIMLLEWGADSSKNRVDEAVDTFVFRDGLIRVQTVRSTMTPKA